VLNDAAFGAATEVTPKFISPADPAALDGRPRREGLPPYVTNYLVNVDYGIIVDVEATPRRAIVRAIGR
jgi:hypothetical protein